MGKAQHHLDQLILELDEVRYRQLIKELKAIHPPLHSEHYALLSNIRQNAPEGAGLSAGYVARLPHHRHKLYDTVCRLLLHHTHPERSGRGLRHQLEVAHMLRHMGLLRLCADQLRRAMADATHACDLGLELECLDLERVVLKDVTGTEARRVANRCAIRTAQGNGQAVMEVRLLADEMLDLTRKETPTPGSAAMLRAQHMMAQAEQYPAGPDAPFKLRSHRLSLSTMYHRWAHGFAAAAPFTEAHLALWDERPTMVQHMPQAYISTVQNAISYQLGLGHTEAYDRLRPRLDHPALRSAAYNVERFKAIEMTYLRHRLELGLLDSVSADRPRLLSNMTRMEGQLPPSFVQTMKLNLGMHAWLMGDVRSARRLLLDVADGPHRHAKEVLVPVASVHLILLEMDRARADEALAQRCLRQLDGLAGHAAYVALLRRHMATLTDAVGAKELKNFYQLAEAELQQLLQQHPKLSGADSYLLWLRHCTTGQRLRDLYVAQARAEAGLA